MAKTASPIPEHLKFDRSLSVAELITRYPLRLSSGSAETKITHVSPSARAVAGGLVALYDAGHIAHLPAGHGFICLTTAALAEHVSSACPDSVVLVCDNPRRTYADILAASFSEYEQTSADSHDTAVIDPSSSVHREAVIGPYAVIGPNCVVAAGVTIGAHTVLARDVHLGQGCVISEHCWLGWTVMGAHTRLAQTSVVGKRGFGFEGRGQEARFIPHLGRVVIGEGCDIGAGVTIDRGVLDDTCLGAYVMIDNQVHIAHNVTIGDNTIILAQTGIAGSTDIGANCVFGGQVGIADHLSICDGVTVASKSGITKDIGEPGSYAGFPAEPARRFWAKQAAVRRLLKAGTTE